MKKTMKKITAVILALCFAVNTLPAVVAEESTGQEHLFTYRDVEFSVPNPENINSVKAFSGEPQPRVGAETIPKSYSSVSEKYVSTAKHQGNYGSCWAFSATSAAETSMMINSGEKYTSGNSAYDFSELQLVYFFYHKKIDPLGNATGDETKNIGKSCLELGGNNLFTMWALAGWTNATTETVLPYSAKNCTAAINGTLSDSYANKYDVAHLQNAYIIPYSTGSTDMNNIKEAIMKYGSVSCSYYHSDDDYSSSNATYYTSYDGGTNHAVTIVGWNDDYSAKNFSRSTASGRPSANGAWLVKNSWGSSWGTDGDASATNSGAEGYFWLSYYDKSLAASKKVFAYDYYPAEQYKYNYQYDGSCGIHTHSLSSREKVAAIYTVKGLSSDYEKLEAVGLGVYSAGRSGTVYIYADPQNNNPVSGKLVSQQDFTTVYSGYYTVPLTTCPVFKKGQNYSVVVKFNSSTTIFVDDTYENGGWISFTADTDNDRTYIISSGGSAQNLKSSGETARIKAFTNDAKTYKVSFNANGGINAPEDVYKGETADLTLPASIPTRTGYDFIGWATESDASAVEYEAGGIYKTDADITLYAVWTPKKATSFAISEDEIYVDEGGTPGVIEIIPTPKDAMYEWTVNGVEENEDTFKTNGIEIVRDGNIFSIYAKEYTKDAVVLCFHDNNSGKEISCTVHVEKKSTIAKSVSADPSGLQITTGKDSATITLCTYPEDVMCEWDIPGAEHNGDEFYIDGIKLVQSGNEFTVEAVSYVSDYLVITFVDKISQCSADLVLYVSRPFVGSISLSESAFSLDIGDTKEITVSVSPEEADYYLTVDGTDDKGPVYYLDGLEITKKSDNVFTVEAISAEAESVLLVIYDTYTENYDTCLVHVHSYNLDAWECTEEGHYHPCSCGAKSEISPHSGGTATCKKKAVCEICEAEYGELDPNNHEGGTEVHDGDVYCKGCKEKISSGGAGTSRGDANGDGFVDTADAVSILQFILHTEEVLENNADCNKDGVIDTADATMVLQYILHICTIPE